MTRDNLIFLGACSLLAPSTTQSAVMNPSDFQTLIDSVLGLSAYIYGRQHVQGEEATPAAAETLSWYVEMRYTSTGPWRGSNNRELKVPFPTKAAADQAIGNWGTHGVYYRSVSKLTPKPLKYRVERYNSRVGE